jgi:voltage-gated potassium channel Kch
VILIDDPAGAARVVATAARVAQGVPVIIRARYLREAGELLSLGASAVVAEEVEGAVEVIERMLQTIEVPRDAIEQQLEAVRTRTQTGSA